MSSLTIAQYNQLQRALRPSRRGVYDGGDLWHALVDGSTAIVDLGPVKITFAGGVVVLLAIGALGIAALAVL